MNVEDKQLRHTIRSDAASIGVTDHRSILIITIGRVAQEALRAEIETLTSTGAARPIVESYRAERTAQINAWMEREISRIDTVSSGKPPVRVPARTGP